MVNQVQAVSCLFSFRFNDKLTPEQVMQTVKGILKGKLDLDVISSVPLNQGSSLMVFATPSDGCNPSLTAVLKMYLDQSFVTLDLEGAAPINSSSSSCADDPVTTVVTDASSGDNHDDGSGSSSSDIHLKAINNNTMSGLRDCLSHGLGIEVEKIPVIKRSPDVPVYFASSDDRILEYDFDETLFNQRSPFQKVCIYHSPSLGNALLLDDLQNLAEADLNYTRGLMHYGSNSYTGKEILILGGGDGALLHELVKEKPSFVTMVDIDSVVMESCRQHLRKACGSTLDTFKTDMYHVIVGDCVKYLEECVASGKTFDVVFNDLTDIPISSEQNEVGRRLWEFVRNILNLSLKCLKPDGKYLNHAVGIGCTDALAAYEQVLNHLPEKVTFSKWSAWVPSFLEEWVFYEVRKA